MATPYELGIRYYNEPAKRSRLNHLVREVFGLDLWPWNDLGYNFVEYTPFSLFDGERAVANVSASPMSLTVNGAEMEAVQVGTVCCRPELRRRGLIRDLMQVAHSYWDGKCAFSYLFPNETVMEFYQQFGYRPVAQHRFRCAAPDWHAAETSARKLHLDDLADLAFLRGAVDERAPVSGRLGVRRDAWIWLFHARLAHADRLRFIAPLDLVVVSRVEGERLHLIDLVGARIPTLAELYPHIGAATIREIEFHFTPDRLEPEGLITECDRDAPLFVRGDFPDVGGPFRFPATSWA